jgi:acrylyl-CoA reductase (NADPH)
MTFKALLTTKADDVISTRLVDFKDEDLMAGDVTVAVEYSTVNYKDAMALSGRSPVIRQFPLIPGIDFAGIVETSSHAGFQAGDRVLVNGWGLSQTHHGG